MEANLRQQQHIERMAQQSSNAEAETRRADSMSAQLSDAIRDRDRAREAAESWKQLAENHRKRLDNVQEAMNGPTP
jgi:hypothetical protein